LREQRALQATTSSATWQLSGERRVDIYEFDFAEVRLLQQLQGFEVVAFDEQVFGGVEVD
jgi:hypothetical protein